MKEKVVAEVTRIGQKFNIRLLYGDSRETVRFCRDEVQKFACFLMNKAFVFDNVGGFVLYDCEKEANITKVGPESLGKVAIEGGENLGRYEAISFLNTMGYGLQNAGIGEDLLISVPDLGLEVKFDEPWMNLLSTYFD